MYIILAIGALIALINTLLTWNELKPFRVAIATLMEFTKQNSSFWNFICFPFRVLTLLPKLIPLSIDIVIAIVCSSIGLGGGVFGALIGLAIGFTVSLLIKINRYLEKGKYSSVTLTDWRVS